jgi:CHAD domain-containing protein
MGRQGRDSIALMRRYEHDLMTARRRIDRLLADPGWKNIHRVRTAIRRLQAAHLLLPGAARKRRRITGYMARMQEFLKATNPVRDADIIRPKLVHHLRGEGAPRGLGSLQKERLRATTRAVRLGKKLRRASGPRVVRSDLTDVTVRRRTGKLTARLTLKVRTQLRVAVMRGGRVEEMHRLRRDSKRLRYVLEASDRAGEVPGAIGDLRKLQDRLGHLHDCDVTLQWLERHPLGGPGRAVAGRVRSERDQLFLRFVREFGPAARALPHLRPLRQ